MSKITAKLNSIQTNLKVPKSQTNTFGKYKYRSCEDITKAVTPHLQETGTTLILKDDIVMVGERIYVKATATIICAEGGGEISATGFAREPLTKKGQDDSQITGAASSYARKYALNGLFAIDDTKDADATNQHGKVNQQKNKTTPVPQEKVDADDNQLNEIKLTLKELDKLEDVDQYAKSIQGVVKDMLPDYQTGVKDLFAEKMAKLNA